MTIALAPQGDQAAGLRRLLRPAGPRMIALCSPPGAGRTVLCAGLAGALARMGRRVLVLDCAAAGPAPPGVPPVRSGPVARSAVAVVHADPAFRALTQLAASDRDRLVRALEAVRADSDCVLVDTAGDDLALAAACGELVLVLRPRAEDVLDSYRLLKRMAPALAGRSVPVVVNRTPPGVPSMRFFGNLSATARQFLGMSLEFAGEIPEDDSLQRASSLKRSVVDVFPGTPAARAVRSCAFGLLSRHDAEAPGVDAFVHRLSAAARALARPRPSTRTAGDQGTEWGRTR